MKTFTGCFFIRLLFPLILQCAAFPQLFQGFPDRLGKFSARPLILFTHSRDDLLLRGFLFHTADDKGSRYFFQPPMSHF